MSKATAEVKWKSRLKGYGYINPHVLGEEDLVHHSAKKSNVFPKLYEGDRVAFETSDNSKEPKTKKVSRNQK